jgi:DNA-binding transcriptional MerR regulator
MKTYTISKLAKAFGLSRSTLLYYDRIGLLKPSDRTHAGYRLYTQQQYETLERICTFREAGMPLVDIQKLLSCRAGPSVKILEEHLHELGEQIIKLRSQQHSIIAMLKTMTGKSYTPVVNKEMWVHMLEAAGMDEAAMIKWHIEFERCAPSAHYEFLLSLGIPEEEAKQIQTWVKQQCPEA